MHPITRWWRLPFGALVSIAAACGQGPAADQPILNAAPTAPWAHATLAEARTVGNPTIQLEGQQSGRVPDLGGSGLRFSGSGSGTFNVAASTAPGSASFTGAPIYDWTSDQPPSVLGTGSFSISVAGRTYANTGTAQSIAEVYPDPETSVSRLLLASWVLENDPVSGAELATVVYVVVLASDFAPGATVAFDGADRLAYFAYGDTSVEQPEVVAAAVTGSITFGASGGLLVGDLLDANASGEFGQIEWTEPESQQPPPAGTTTVAPGTYQLTIVTGIETFCDGSLAGQEAAFAGITASDIGLLEGQVVLDVASPTALEVSGAAVATFGTPRAVLESTPDAPPGMYWTSLPRTGTGPAGSELYGAFLAIDATQSTPTSIVGYAGLGYITSDQGGFCQVAVAFELQP